MCGSGIGCADHMLHQHEVFSTGCCFQRSLSSMANCSPMNLQAAMSIECCMSCSGRTCGQSHGSPLLRLGCNHCKEPKPCNGTPEALMLLQSLDPTCPSEVSCQELSSSISDMCIYYGPPSQQNSPCALYVHSQELLFLLVNQIDTHNR